MRHPVPVDQPADGLRPHLAGLLSLAAASCLAVTTEMLPVGLLPAIGESFGIAGSATGLLISLYAAMVAVFAVPLTLSTTRSPRKPLLLATLSCYALSNVLVALAPTFVVLATGRALGGLTHALFFSLCIGYAPRLVPGAHTGRALVIVASGATAGFVLGVPSSTSLGTALGWRTSFAVLAALSFLTLALVAKLLPPVPNDRPDRPPSTAGARAALAVVVASNTLTFLGQFTLYTFISLVFLGAGARPALIGPLLLMCGISGLVGLTYAAHSLDRRPRRTSIVILALVIIGVAVLGVGFSRLAAVCAAAAVWSAAFGGVPSIYQASAVRINVATPELAGAWINSSANIGIAGGAALGAALMPLVGLGGLPWVSATLVGLGLSVVLLARKSFPSRVPPQATIIHSVQDRAP
ncbi:MFS transporter [Mycobacterium yunnanensis]|nr:MFS transporter [Mycobacterium yunnanensis]